MTARTHRLIPGRFRYADAHDMYELLGVKSLPIEGMPGRSIHGVWVYVKPLPPPSGEVSRWSGRPVRNFNGLRVMAVCSCGRHIAVGRLHQHRCKPYPDAPGYDGGDAIHEAADAAAKRARDKMIEDRFNRGECEHGYADNGRGCRGCDPDI